MSLFKPKKAKFSCINPVLIEKLNNEVKDVRDNTHGVTSSFVTRLYNGSSLILLQCAFIVSVLHRYTSFLFPYTVNIFQTF